MSIMSDLSSVTIISDKKLRGVLAPKDLLSKKMLEDIVDLIESSSHQEIKKSEGIIREADRDNLWISGEEAENRLKVRLKASK
jgi:hypothetical protein